MKPIQMAKSDKTGYVIRYGEQSGKPRIHPVFLYQNTWWNVNVISARYGVYEVSELTTDEYIWSSISDAETGLTALAILASAEKAGNNDGSI